MKTNNIDTIQEVVDYIEEHLDETLNLDSISGKMHYSKYHLSRMFVSIVGFTLVSLYPEKAFNRSGKITDLHGQTDHGNCFLCWI